MKALRNLRMASLTANSPLADSLERELRAVGGVVLFGLRVNGVDELATIALGGFAVSLLAVAVGAVFGGVNPLASVLLLGGLGTLFYISWRRPIEEYKSAFLRDGELPAAMEVIVGGLEAGMNVESMFPYLAKYFKGVVGRLFVGVQDDIDAGKSMSEALKTAAERSLNPYFQRFVALVVAGREMGGGDTQHYLKQLLEEVEDVRTNERIEAAGRINNTLFFPIFLGYFLPILVLFSLPFIFSLRGMFRIF